MEKLGIENIKTIVEKSLQFAEALDKRYEDGKLSFVEIVTLLPTTVSLGISFGSIGDAIKEVNDLDNSEREELKQVVEDFDLRNDDAEEVAEICLNAFIALTKLRELETVGEKTMYVTATVVEAIVAVNDLLKVVKFN